MERPQSARGENVAAHLDVQQLPDAKLGGFAQNAGLRAGRQTTGSRELLDDLLDRVVRAPHVCRDGGEGVPGDPQRDDPASRLPRQRVTRPVMPAVGVAPQEEVIGVAVANRADRREVHEQHEAAQQGGPRDVHLPLARAIVGTLLSSRPRKYSW